MPGRFIHLHTHSHYSFLQALPKVPELVGAAKDAGMDAVGLTDAGNLHGAIEFYKVGTKKGVKPIIGVDAYLAPRSRLDKEQSEEGKRTRIVLLAENNEGYQNLLILVTKAFTEGFFEKPRMDKELLRAHNKGLIAIIPSFAGDVAQQLKAGDAKGAAAVLEEYVTIFGKENVFLEISHHPGVPGHMSRMEAIKKLSVSSGVPLVAQHDVYYLKPDDQEATEVMRRIAHGNRGDANQEEDFSFVTEKQMREWFKDVPEAVEHSGEIADRCNVTFDLGKWTFPAIDIPEGETHESELRKRTYAGIEHRKMELTEEVKTRIEYELDVIITKGFAPYFLTVSDLLTYAKSVGILTTTRGSAAGSIVSYLTGITTVDPIAYKLPFERFLNPERPKAPDIDMDFADNRRDEMIAYAKRKYGEDHVAQIGTFGTLMARAAVRDVSRALGHSYATGDRIAKLIPMGSQGFPMTLKHAKELEPELLSLYNEDDDVKEIYDLAVRIEGCVRHTGVHAAGVVISPTPLTDWTPLQVDQKTGKLITQYDMHAVEEAGLLKFDFLGIKNLAILADAIARVKESRGIEIDIEEIPMDDAKTFEMLARGETEGTFQLNGSGMTRYLKELRPTTIHDINAMVALYRPGPMETIPQYIERKKSPHLITFLDERMKDYLDASYGLLVYQDDVLLTAIKLGGYSWLEADTLRKAMGKKIPVEMEAQKEKLLAGFKEFGKLSDAKGERLWKLIEPFAAYGFNKAHAACYGKVAYQTSYMKANYPVEYMAAVLTADAGDTESISTFVDECERMKIPVLPPDVNESGSDFTVAGENKDVIRFGLTSIKNFGEGISESIIQERKAHGPFTSLADFLSRGGGKSLNRKSLECLIKSGALDRYGDRGYLLSHIEYLLSFHKDSTATAPQDSLFGAMAAPALTLPPSTTETPIGQKLLWEKELLGIYISGHPLDAHDEKAAKAGLTIAQIIENPHPGQTIILPVLVAESRALLTKKGDKMAFLKLEDRTESIEGVIFPKLYKDNAHLLAPGTCIMIKATVSGRNGETSLTLENLKAL
ncbi:MAG: polymerase subunit alpha, polymerase subunit alpha protein [Parcubacteria group bacterium]|nr:polymerase subunit alpha, polymerase subunit alpha protein [Parcubacteria group bacterium]